ncbi:hypothetical protein K435DRAFT_795730 [Dendrothele bispora CBS 962.96]|uniref:Uncharacterized protein n=1 Tax=Dendrothele bispora (strain CBS 962.96) TaxID=1314807 RepID=A0A4S8M990_DENBC|nr:hypothetical protein K435DRAFT_795730 [Dendrothele bispora CBS 962.96]
MKRKIRSVGGHGCICLESERSNFLSHWHPAYIKNNDTGYPICENSGSALARLQYLVQKGAIIRKGKYSQTPQDSTFVAVSYTGDSERVMRYNDEGETSEFCKWTADLSTLPAFQQNALLGQSGLVTIDDAILLSTPPAIQQNAFLGQSGGF